MINDQKKKQIASYAFLVLSSFLMALNAQTFPFGSEVTGIDSSVFIYVAKTILGGEMPYLNTFDHKGPVIYLINVLGLLISERMGIWLLEYITILITFVLAYKIARLLGCRKICACAVVAINALVLNSYFDGGNLVEEYACVFLTLSLYLFLQFFKTSQTSAWKIILCGASFAAVFLLRVNMVVLWAVMCIGVLIYNIKKGFVKKTIGFVVWFLFGAALVCVPIMIWLWKKQALLPFIDNYLLFNFMYASASAEAVVRAIIHFCMGSPVVIAVPILVYFCFRKKEIADWLCLVALVLSVLSICVSGRTYAHYGMILYPLIVYAASRVFAQLQTKAFFLSQISKQQKVACTLSIVCAITLLFLNSIAIMTKNLLSIPLQSNSSTEWHQIAEVVKENTNEDERISVCGNQNIIYLLSDRKSASKYSYQYPIAGVNPKIKAEYLDDIRQLKAEIIILQDDYILYDDVMEVVEQHYTLIETINLTHIYLKDS